MKALPVLLTLLVFSHLTEVVTAGDPPSPSTLESNSVMSADEIRKLVDAGDPAAIPHLRQLLAEETNAGYSYKVLGSRADAWRVALAKLGDEEQMRSLLNELKSDDPHAQYVAIQQLIRVGGNRAIHALAELLYSEIGTRGVGPDPRTLPEGVRPVGRELYSPPRWQAVMALEQLVEPLPAERQVESIVTDEHVEQWKQWWEQHKGEYPLPDAPKNDAVGPESAKAPASQPDDGNE